MWEQFWNPTAGWSGWFSLGGILTSDPAVAYNPGNGNVEVYGRGIDNALWEDYWSPSTGGSGWFSLGGTPPLTRDTTNTNDTVCAGAARPNPAPPAKASRPTWEGRHDQ